MGEEKLSLIKIRSLIAPHLLIYRGDWTSTLYGVMFRWQCTTKLELTNRVRRQFKDRTYVKSDNLYILYLLIITVINMSYTELLNQLLKWNTCCFASRRYYYQVQYRYFIPHNAFFLFFFFIYAEHLIHVGNGLRYIIVTSHQPRLTSFTFNIW